MLQNVNGGGVNVYLYLITPRLGLLKILKVKIINIVYLFQNHWKSRCTK